MSGKPVGFGFAKKVVATRPVVKLAAFAEPGSAEAESAQKQTAAAPAVAPLKLWRPSDESEQVALPPPPASTEGDEEERVGLGMGSFLAGPAVEDPPDYLADTFAPKHELEVKV
jgi:hypothetical protein